jgi:hypothetical protein
LSEGPEVAPDQFVVFQADRRLNPVARGGSIGVIFTTLPKCGAYARTTGKPCQMQAMRGKSRCSLHGGKNPEPPIGNQNGLKSRKWSAEQVEQRRQSCGVAARRLG